MKNNKKALQKFSLSYYALPEKQQPGIKVFLNSNCEATAHKDTAGQERKNIFALGSH
jgi:hypothetical protein